MNVLFADQFSEPGGAQRCLMDLLPAVLERGWKPLVLAPGEGDLLQWCQAHGVPWGQLPLSGYSAGRKSAVDALRFAAEWPRVHSALREAARRHRAALLYINGPRLLPACAGLNTPALFHAHSIIGGALPRQLAKWALRRKRIPIIAVSQFVARQFPPAQAEVIHNGVADCRRERPTYAGPLRIAILGRIAPEKGQLDFVRAAALLAGQGLCATFHVFGDAVLASPVYAEAVRSQARGVPVTFHGWTDTAGALAVTDILAVPSGPLEGAGRVVPEAYSAGVPVVAYPASGLAEFIRHRQTGMLTEQPSPASLASVITELTNNPAMRTRLTEAARRAWNEGFTLERYRARVCEQMLQAARPRPSMR
jgi:glycosyltransferase involved in cell wall biosynthesis